MVCALAALNAAAAVSNNARWRMLFSGSKQFKAG
jgi:hypothetical protein